MKRLKLSQRPFFEQTPFSGFSVVSFPSFSLAVAQYNLFRFGRLRNFRKYFSPKDKFSGRSFPKEAPPATLKFEKQAGFVLKKAGFFVLPCW